MVTRGKLTEIAKTCKNTIISSNNESIELNEGLLDWYQKALQFRKIILFLFFSRKFKISSIEISPKTKKKWQRYVHKFQKHQYLFKNGSILRSEWLLDRHRWPLKFGYFFNYLLSTTVGPSNGMGEGVWLFLLPQFIFQKFEKLSWPLKSKPNLQMLLIFSSKLTSVT